MTTQRMLFGLSFLLLATLVRADDTKAVDGLPSLHLPPSLLDQADTILKERDATLNAPPDGRVDPQEGEPDGQDTATDETKPFSRKWRIPEEELDQ